MMKYTTTKATFSIDTPSQIPSELRVFFHFNISLPKQRCPFTLVLNKNLNKERKCSMKDEEYGGFAFENPGGSSKGLGTIERTSLFFASGTNKDASPLLFI